VIESRRIVRRFLLLRASRWLPTGLIIPVFVLYLVDRGLSLTRIGLAVAVQGVVVMLLEIPTGGLADAAGRKGVLLAANLFDMVALALLLAGRSLPWFAAAFAFEGVFRALESGPLDAWFVDAVKELDADYRVESGLGRGGMVLGLAIAAGSLLSGLLVSTHPIHIVDPLALPLLAALILRAVDTILISRLMTETYPSPERGSIRTELRRVPSVIGDVFALVRTSTALTLVVAVELLWGFGAGAFEGLFPPRLGEVLSSSERAAALMGPVAAAAWVASAAGAAVVPWASRRFGRHAAAAAMRVAQGATVALMGIFAGTAGLISAYLACYVVHGAANPVHAALLHDEAVATNRTTVLSLNSMAGQAAGAIGVIALGAIADSQGISAGMYVGAVVLAAAAPLYLLAGRHRQETPEAG
jgi:MFS family permease